MSRNRDNYNPFQNDFSGGEISERLTLRFDTDTYQRSVSRATNMIPDPAGPLRRRGGTRFIRGFDVTGPDGLLIDPDFRILAERGPAPPAPVAEPVAPAAPRPRPSPVAQERVRYRAEMTVGRTAPDGNGTFLFGYGKAIANENLFWRVDFGSAKVSNADSGLGDVLGLVMVRPGRDRTAHANINLFLEDRKPNSDRTFRYMRITVGDNVYTLARSSAIYDASVVHHASGLPWKRAKWHFPRFSLILPARVGGEFTVEFL